MMLAMVLALWPGRLHARDFWEEPAIAAHPPRGPAVAKGIIVYNHGTDDFTEQSRAPVQPLMLMLARDNWDVVKLSRRRAADHLRPAEDALVAQVRRLRARGYERIVLAGPSRGGFLALMAATRVPVFAVIATAPGGYGTRDHGAARSLAELQARLPLIRGARVLIVDTAGDPRVEQVGGRGPALSAALARAGLRHLVIDRPPGFRGHTAAMTGRFARVYGECVRRFLEPEPGRCLPYDGGDLPLPPQARDMAANGLLGRWLGVYPNGDARMLAVTRMDGARAEAWWSWGGGPAAGRQRKPGTERMECRAAGKGLTCRRSKGTARFTLTRTGVVEYSWRPDRGKGPSLTLEMRRPGRWRHAQ